MNSLFDALCSVASETLQNENYSSDSPEIKTSNNVKKQVKKYASTILTLDDIRSLPAKSLIEKFTEMTSDEYTKKYSYKCLLLPHKCTAIFKSFGNEKKACDKIKSHLISHVQQLLLDYESNKEVSEMVFIPRSPSFTVKNVEKLSKKSRKHHISRNNMLPHASSFKSFNKMKKSEILLKKAKKMNKSKKYRKDIKNCYRKNKTKLIDSVCLKSSPSDNDEIEKGLDFDEQSFMNNLFDNEDNEWGNGYCSKYSKHLQCIFFSNDDQERLYDESDYDEVSDSNEYDSHLDEISETTTNIINTYNDKAYLFLHDHNYASFEESRRDRLLEFKNLPRKYEDPFLQPEPESNTQLIIRTPPFPFLHTPLLPEVAEIIEIDVAECLCGAEECSKYASYLSQTQIKEEVEEMQTNDPLFDYEEKYSNSIFYKMGGASSSVLECVENIVNKKHLNSSVPKSELSSSENDENLENMQKVEKELALKYIAKLHSKGKRRIPDSLMCQICPDKHFTAQATLIHHYRSHAGIKPYICEICSAKFTRQHSLNYHMLIHENRSRFTCEFCGRTFRHPSHYKEHLRRHTGETPYHCTDCNLHFKTRNTFKRHLKTRHGKLLTAGGIEDLIVE